MSTESGRIDEPQISAPRETWVQRVQATLAEWLAMHFRAPRVRAITHAPWRTSPRLWWASVALLLIILATMWMFDVWAIRSARTLPRGLIRTFSTITEYGKSGYFLWPIGILLIATWLAQPRLRRFGQGVLTAVMVRLSFIFLAIALPGLFSAIAKQIIGRARPFVPDNIPDAFIYKPLSWGAAYASLPSGHTTTSFAALVAFGALWPVLRPVLWIYALLIGLSRIIVTAHHPSDVIVGAVVGTVGALLVRDWFAARRLVFTISPEGNVKAMPGPSIWRVGRLVRDTAKGYF